MADKLLIVIAAVLVVTFISGCIVKPSTTQQQGVVTSPQFAAQACLSKATDQKQKDSCYIETATAFKDVNICSSTSTNYVFEKSADCEATARDFC